MKNPMDLSGRTILVTGAAQGIGAAAARLIAGLGGTPVLVDLNGDKLRSMAEELGLDPSAVHVGSVLDADFIAATIEDAARRHGKVDGLVNNAGVTRPATIAKMTAADWQTVIDVNLTGVHLCQQAVGRHILSRVEKGSFGSGAIVNVSSIAGRRGTFGQVNYAAAKAGVYGLTMTAAKEWAAYGIRVNSVAFGIVETPMTTLIRSEDRRDGSLRQIPLGRFGKPEEVVMPICFLLSEAASYITGQNITADGGIHIGF